MLSRMLLLLLRTLLDATLWQKTRSSAKPDCELPVVESSKYNSLFLSFPLSLSLAAMNSPHIMFRQQANPPRVCLLLQDLVQSCARVGRRIVEDMCYETRRAPSPPLPPRAHARSLSLSLSVFSISLSPYSIIELRRNFSSSTSSSSSSFALSFSLSLSHALSRTLTACWLVRVLSEISSSLYLVVAVDYSGSL